MNEKIPQFFHLFNSSVRISISVMRETSDLIEKCGGVTDYTVIINCHGIADAYK